MATVVDNLSKDLSKPLAPNRVSYSLGRMLGVEDFQADQDYHRGRLARALLQLCGTGTVSGLNVVIPQIWAPNAQFAASAFIFDPAQNVQVNTGLAGKSGPTAPAFAAAPGGTVNDGTGIVWTNHGPLDTNGWKPNSPFVAPKAIIDANNNVQVLNVSPTVTTGATTPVWNTAIGATTADGANTAAWLCAGPSELEIEVTPGLAIDRVGRMIEVPRTVCIRITNWLANQTVSDLNSARHGGNVLVDVFATFTPCTRGVTPSFATQDDYDATDAFAANRMLDSFAMQLVLRTDSGPSQGSAPPLPQDPWLVAGALTPPPIGAATVENFKRIILTATYGALPTEYPPKFDATSVFLARIAIPSVAGAPGQPPQTDLTAITIDNLSRLFVYPASLAARSIGLSSGTEA